MRKLKTKYSHLSPTQRPGCLFASTRFFCSDAFSHRMNAMLSGGAKRELTESSSKRCLNATKGSKWVARRGVRWHRRGKARLGLVAFSHAQHLAPLAIDVRANIASVQSFLASPPSSSYPLPNYQKFLRSKVRGRKKLGRRRYRKNACDEMLAQARLQTVIDDPQRWRHRRIGFLLRACAHQSATRTTSRGFAYPPARIGGLGLPASDPIASVKSKARPLLRQMT